MRLLLGVSLRNLSPSGVPLLGQAVAFPQGEKSREALPTLPPRSHSQRWRSLGDLDSQCPQSHCLEGETFDTCCLLFIF